MDKTIDVGAVNWNKTAVQYMELNKQKTEAIQRVRELHKSVMVVNKEFCIICENHQQDMSPFPCETIQALDGEQ